jgi:DNA-3-methyladenine glycosylase
MVLEESFYTRADVVQVARDLLGKVLVTQIDGIQTAGIIVETEAYAGPIDKASHAWGGRRTRRTEVMYGRGGVAYVYLCYGIHHLFNVVTNVEDIPNAVLVRAVEPVEGIDEILLRRKKDKLSPLVSAGPGALSDALGIRTSHTGLSLQGPGIWIEDRGIKPAKKDIIAATRVGVAYAADHALWPYRFYIRGNKYVSKGKGL